MALLKDSGIDPTYYNKIAQAEAGNNPNAKNNQPGQTASGLYQFTAGTWKSMVDKMGLNYSLEDRFDPIKAKVVMEQFTKENANQLQKALGRTPNNTDLYTAHFLGAGGASYFLKRLQNDPNGSPMLSEDVIKPNKGIFYTKNGKPRTNIEVYNELARRINQPVKKDIKTENITPVVTNFNIPQESTNFVSVENPQEKDSKEVEQASEAIDTKTKELNFLKDIMAGQVKQEQPEQIEEETPIQQQDILGQFNQISNFVEAREGGFFEQHFREGGFFNGDHRTLYQEGGIPVSSQGMYKYPNQRVIVPTSGAITMKNIPHKIEATSLETGEKKIMLPNMEYFFKNTKNVLEIPIK